jgi:cell division protease FtsH
MPENKQEKKCWDEKGAPRDCGPGEKPPLLPPFNKGQFRFSIWYFVAVLVIIFIVNSLISVPREQLIEYSDFKEKIRSGEIKRVEMSETLYKGYPYSRAEMEATEIQTRQPVSLGFRTTPVDDPEFVSLMDERGVEYYAIPSRQSPLLGLLLSWVVPLGIMFLVWRFLFKRMGNMGADVLSFGRNKSQIVAEGDTGVRFDDVAGVEEAKAELVEVVDFLKNPSRYTNIGGKIPKGVLLVGAPGTGKTLLARAVAGEAGVTFFRMSGADFVEMFVGVGAARVRDLFKQARAKAPCIIFIDELDAMGRARAVGVGSNDEREQTLNQLLVEMDGFDSRTGVILLAATNRPEILDPALLRPGRFDRQVLVDKPDLTGRKAILEIHAKDVKLAEGVDLERVAKRTPGFVGADLANVVNEAALLTVRAGRERVSQVDFDAAIEKVVAGLEKKTKLINPKERRVVAYHETGHGLVAYFTPGADSVEKISIVPRGMSALGYTIQLPEEERYLLTEKELYGKIDVLLGGRAAEQLAFGEISTGAANDLTRATDIAKRMITDYGMSEKFKNVHLPYRRENAFLGGENYSVMREYSESTQQYIDEETSRIIRERYEYVGSLLKEREDLLKGIAERLLETETLSAEEFLALIPEDAKAAAVGVKPTDRGSSST